ncbi:hypothetical protein [Actinokineospora inagensis]|uniref:hypothetical protein n=1 Tax=Actinokineospora inagensis TaxID=103730 RepID=UPI0004155749|nr:hypothetical protein [Actinokineospora inagensis]
MSTLLAAACSTAPQAADPATMVGWADRLCGVVVDAGAALATPPPEVDVDNADAARSALLGYLTALTDGVNRAITAIDALGPSPISGGDRAAQVAADTYRGMRAPLSEARTALHDNTGPEVVAEVAGEVAPRVAGLDLADPTAGMAGSDFARWAGQAPRCGRLLAAHD